MAWLKRTFHTDTTPSDVPNIPEVHPHFSDALTLRLQASFPVLAARVYAAKLNLIIS